MQRGGEAGEVDSEVSTPDKAWWVVTESEQPDSARIRAQDDIEMRLGANLVHLPIVRSVAANIAMRADFDLDTISDFELAVDEACSSLISRAVPDSILVCRFTIGADAITLSSSVPTDDGAQPNTSTFGWQVLNTLTDSAHTWTEVESMNGQDSAQQHPERHRVHIELGMRKPAGQG